MPTLHIDLRDGFKHDDVLFLLNGREAGRCLNVTTNLAISYAAAKEIPAPEGPCLLKIEIPKQGISSSVDVDPALTPFISIFVIDGKIDFHKLQEPLPIL